MWLGTKEGTAWSGSKDWQAVGRGGRDGTGWGEDSGAQQQPAPAPWQDWDGWSRGLEAQSGRHPGSEGVDLEGLLPFPCGHGGPARLAQVATEPIHTQAPCLGVSLPPRHTEETRPEALSPGQPSACVAACYHPSAGAFPATSHRVPSGPLRQPLNFHDSALPQPTPGPLPHLRDTGRERNKERGRITDLKSSMHSMHIY